MKTLIEILTEISGTVECKGRRYFEIDNAELQETFQEYCKPSEVKAYIERLEAADEKCWQPIETCPKDGKYYLLYRKGEVRQARWKGNMWGGNGWYYDFPENVANGFTENMPTHWQNLPKPPAMFEAASKPDSLKD